MATVAEIELEQKVSELIQFVREYSAIRKGDFTVKLKREKALLTCVDRDVTLDFSV